MKTTKWFPGNVKPVRDGLYQRRYGSKVVYWAMFREGKWRFACGMDYRARAEKERGLSPFQSEANIVWRGLTSKGGK